MELAPDAVALVCVEPGPRFTQVEAVPPGKLRLTVEAPAGLDQVLEASTDLHDWLAVDTLRPGPSPFVVELAAPSTPVQFFRLRW